MAKKKLAEAGCGGEAIVVIAPTELTGIRALSLIGGEQMRRAGLNVDLQEMEFGTVVKQRARPPVAAPKSVDQVDLMDVFSGQCVGTVRKLLLTTSSLATAERSHRVHQIHQGSVQIPGTDQHRECQARGSI